mgnify:CR=1 FL=1
MTEDDNKASEEAIKKTRENGRKKFQEERGKVDLEEDRKKEALQRAKVHNEEAVRDWMCGVMK